ncbi:hypothetical protein BC828DRAFT_415328 [Blastocladiella britannica]|nr:hypothetical protein BC828DRAFT_415328 [Blastocladiella britannica]
MIDHILYLILAHAAGATFTPEEAITVLNVLPQHGSVLSAVLSRGFSEYKPSNATKSGHGLALLPHYPLHVLFDDIFKTLGAAGALGSLPVLDLLWQLAGPTTAGRYVWLENYLFGLTAQAIENDRMEVLDWFSDVASAANIPVRWETRRWEMAANKGHTRVLLWAIERGYMTELDCDAALLSTQTGDPTVMKWWIARQPSKEVAMAALSNMDLVRSIAATKTLDWWWANAHSGGLPDSDSFASLIDTLLFRGDIDAVEWWWARFLEHRTPEHTFGTQRAATGLLLHREFAVVEWLWDHSHASGNHYDPTAFPFFSPDWHGIPTPSIFSSYSPANLPFLQWAAARSAALGQRLGLSGRFVFPWIVNNRVEMLDYALESGDVLEVVWASDIVSTAIDFAQVEVLEWWDRHQDQLPPQDLDCSSGLLSVAQRDAADVLEWWHAHPQLSASKNDWQQVCLEAIKYDANRVQRWLLKHMGLFAPDEYDTVGFHASVWDLEMTGVTLFTLEFMSAISPAPVPSTSPQPLSPPPQVYTLFASLLCYCHRYNVTIASLLPLGVADWLALLRQTDLTMLEWWLQAHLATSRRVVLPGAEELGRAFSDADDDDSRHWLSDVTVTRGISMYIESEVGIVRYCP